MERLYIIISLFVLAGCALHLNEIQVTVNEGPSAPEVSAQSSSFGMRSGDLTPPTVDTDSRQSGSGVNININIANPNAQDQQIPLTIPVKPF